MASAGKMPALGSVLGDYVLLGIVPANLVSDPIGEASVYKDLAFAGDHHVATNQYLIDLPAIRLQDDIDV